MKVKTIYPFLLCSPLLALCRNANGFVWPAQWCVPGACRVQSDLLFAELRRAGGSLVLHELPPQRGDAELSGNNPILSLLPHPLFLTLSVFILFGIEIKNCANPNPTI